MYDLFKLVSLWYSVRMKTTTISIVQGALIALLISILGGGGLFGYAIYADSAYADTFFPREQIAGVNYGGQTFLAVEEHLVDASEEYLDSIVTVSYQDQQVRLSPRNLGVSVDIPATTAPLRSVHTGRNRVAKLALALRGIDVPLRYEIDQQQFMSTLYSSFDFETVEAQQAEITYSSRTDSFEVSDSIDGSDVDIHTLYNALLRGASSLELSSPRHALHDVAVPAAITRTEAEQVLAATLPLLEGDVQLTAGDSHWEIPRATLREWVIFAPEVRDDAIVLAPGFLATDLRAYLLDRSAELGTLPRNARLGVDASGRAIIVEEGIAGVSIATDAHLDSFNEQFFTRGHKQLQLAIETSEPLVRADNLAELGLLAKIGEGSSDFVGSSPNRVHNVHTGAKKFDGVLIAPNEEFSFNKTLGSADAKDGFVNALVISGSDIVPSLGGGLCQVSTTAFRAAAFTGLDITERYPHSFHVSYYGDPGFDATIWLGGKDFKFRNDTQGYLYMQTSIVGTELTFEFYGTPDGRSVAINGPYITSGGGSGSTSTNLVRTITYGDGTVVNENYSSFYKPRSAFQTAAEKQAAERKKQEEQQAAEQPAEESSEEIATEPAPTPEPTPVPPAPTPAEDPIVPAS